MSPMASARSLFASQRFTSALRFCVAVFVIDTVAIAIFGNGADTMFGSYASIALLYFCDFDGSLRSRSIAFLATSLFGLVGLVLGVLVAPSLIASIAAVFVVSLVLSLARSMFGNVAKGVVGAQLAFLIAIMSPAPIDRLGNCVASWIIGAAIASVVGIFIFPRHRSRAFRIALGEWCERAAEFSNAVAGTDDVTPHVTAVIEAWSHVQQCAAQVGNRPGWLGQRTRVLAQMLESAQSATSLLRTYEHQPAPMRDLDADLVRATVDAFSWCGSALKNGSSPSSAPSIKLADLRSADRDEMADWSAKQTESHVNETLTVLQRHHTLRVMTVIAVAFLYRTEAYLGRKEVEQVDGFPSPPPPQRMILSTLSARSVWFRHGIQAGIGMAAAVWIARSLGVAHGFWVVMTALGLLHVSFSPSASGRGALKAGLGTALGVAVGAVILTLHLPVWALGALVPLSAFAAKWEENAGLVINQFVFTILALINTTYIGWPTLTRGVAAIRFFDVVIGLIVAVAAMTLVFPGGPGVLLRRCGSALRDLSNKTIIDSHHVLQSNSGDEGLVADQIGLSQEITRFSGTITAAFQGDDVSAHADPWRQLGGWGRQCLLGSALTRGLAARPMAPSDVPTLASALRADPGSIGAAVAAAIQKDPSLLTTKAPETINALWGAWWVDHMATNMPDGLPELLGKPPHHR